ncbi:MAG TPA: peptide deformylase [Thermoanaerobaculia bacterium]|nr:peptide deformylase [Thermoanaerobaculia bacterium]
MAIRPIRLYPDPVLRRPTDPVVRFDEELAELTRDMVETMHAAPGLGLAAPQVGVSLRLAVVDLSVGKDESALTVMANPRILSREGEEIDEEGCLSIPELTAKLGRPARVRVTAQSLTGEVWELDAEGMLARAICHEVDHLEGVLFVDHLRGLRRERAKRFLKRMAKEWEER